jgi:hypothetical protein
MNTMASPTGSADVQILQHFVQCEGEEARRDVYRSIADCRDAVENSPESAFSFHQLKGGADRIN